MSYFPVTHYRLFNDPFDRFFGDQLNFFDPWRDFDTFPTALSSFPNSFRWINRPREITHRREAAKSLHTTSNNFGAGSTLLPTSNNFGAGSTLLPITPPTPLTSIIPVLSEKFRVQLNVAGFNPDTIKTRVEGRKVIVEAKQEDRDTNGDYSVREIRKTYDLPEHAESSNLASFVTPNNMLVIEVPINRPLVERRPSQTMADAQALSLFGQFRDPFFDYPSFMASSEFRPQIIDIGNGQRQIKLSLAVRNYRPEQIKVSVKNNELRVEAEHIYQDNNRSERSFLTKSIALPPGTQVDQLKSFLNADGQLEIEAPFIEPTQMRSIEVQH
jgi:HSP20 family molecular chaperone IbpA